MDLLLLPFQLGFMQSAFLVTALVALPCGLLSAIVVLKGWSLIGDAIAHAVLPGVVLAYLIGAPLVVGAFAAGMGAALLTGWLDQHSRVKRDTLMGVVFSGMFALGLVMISQITTTLHLDHILYGNVLGAGARDIWTAGLVAGGVVAVFGLAWRALMTHAFDPVQAHAVGLPTGLLHHGLVAMVAACVVAALAATGMILVIALLITPGATAFLITRRFGRMLIISVVLSVSSGLFGVYLSFLIDSAPAATIVCILTGIFLVTLGLRALALRRLRAKAAR